MTVKPLQRHVAFFVTSATRVRPSNPAACYTPASRTSIRRWQSTNTNNPFAARPPKLSELEIPPECYADKPSFPKPTFGLQATTLNSEQKIDLNTTRPAPLNSPEALDVSKYDNGAIPIGDRAKYLFRLGKSYLSFYKTGLWNIWGNYKQYQVIKKKVAPRPINEVVKYSGQDQGPSLSRAEYQLALRTRHDLLKLIPFSLVFAICGEFTPLVIIAIGSAAVPYTCRIPNQEENDMAKTLVRTNNYMNDIAEVENTVEEETWQKEWREAYRYGLTIFRHPLPVIGSLYHNSVIRPNLIKHCDNVLSDMILLHREGSVAELTARGAYEWANSYDLYALRQYVQENFVKGKGIDMEDMKNKIVPAIEEEVKFTLDQDWERLKPSEQWRTVFRSLGSKSPDWLRRLKHLKQDDKTS